MTTTSHLKAGDLTLTREAQKGGLLNGTIQGLQTTSQSYTPFAELEDSSASYNAQSKSGTTIPTTNSAAQKAK